MILNVYYVRVAEILEIFNFCVKYITGYYNYNNIIVVCCC